MSSTTPESPHRPEQASATTAAPTPAPRRRPVSTLTTLGRLAGAIGAVLLVSALLLAFLMGFVAPVFVNIGLGIIGITLYLVTNFDVFLRMAGSRSTGLLAMVIVSIVLVVGIVGVANYIAYKNPKQFDMTSEGIYTLSEQTTALLGRLKDDVKIYAFFASYDSEYEITAETLERYKQAGPKVSYEIINPRMREDLVKKYGVTSEGSRIVVTARGQDARARDVSEEELTNAIIKVAEQTSKTIYFLTGHGEPRPDDNDSRDGYGLLGKAIASEGFSVKPLSLATGSVAKPGDKVSVGTGTGGTAVLTPPPGLGLAPAAAPAVTVPAEVSVLVVLAPKSPLLPPEVAALEEYLKKGGRLIVMLEPDRDGGLTTFLKQWKVELRSDLVVDGGPLSEMFGPAAPAVQPTEAEQNHPMLRTMSNPAVFTTARSLAVANGGLPGVDAAALLETGTSAWGETNLVDGQAELDDKDHPGPVTVAVVATKPVGDPDKRSDEARLVVYGDSEWVDNENLGMTRQFGLGNSDLIVNTLDWLAEEQQKISIRPPSRGASELFLDPDQMSRVAFFTLELPALIVALGFGIVLLRRQR